MPARCERSPFRRAYFRDACRRRSNLPPDSPGARAVQQRREVARVQRVQSREQPARVIFGVKRRGNRYVPADDRSPHQIAFRHLRIWRIHHERARRVARHLLIFVFAAMTVFARSTIRRGSCVAGGFPARHAATSSLRSARPSARRCWRWRDCAQPSDLGDKAARLQRAIMWLILRPCARRAGISPSREIAAGKVS